MLHFKIILKYILVNTSPIGGHRSHLRWPNHPQGHIALGGCIKSPINSKFHPQTCPSPSLTSNHQRTPWIIQNVFLPHTIKVSNNLVVMSKCCFHYPVFRSKKLFTRFHPQCNLTGGLTSLCTNQTATIIFTLNSLIFTLNSLLMPIMVSFSRLMYNSRYFPGIPFQSLDFQVKVTPSLLSSASFWA